MKFGVFYNPQIPRDPESLEWEPGHEARIFSEMLEQIRFADSLGYDYAFLGEHHFMPEYAHNSATEVVLGALAATTKNIRLGTGIVHASHNDPVRTAERIATLDQISRGRAEFGFGPGTSHEIAPLVTSQRGDVSKYHEVAAAAGQIAADILGSPGVWPGVDNEFFKFPAAEIVPKSYQKPHPPLWTSMGMTGSIADLAAGRGLGSLLVAGAGPEWLAEQVEAYWARLKSGDVKPVGKGINPAVFAFTVGLVAPTEELARERGEAGLDFFGFGVTGGMIASMGDPNHNLHREWLDYKAGRGDVRDRIGVPDTVKEMGDNYSHSPATLLTGPEGARDMARRIEATHADGMLLNQHFGNTKHEHLMESLEIFAKEVMPEFKERDRQEKHAAWRAEQLKDVRFPLATSLEHASELLAPTGS